MMNNSEDMFNLLFGGFGYNSFEYQLDSLYKNNNVIEYSRKVQEIKNMEYKILRNSEGKHKVIKKSKGVQHN